MLKPTSWDKSMIWEMDDRVIDGSGKIECNPLRRSCP